MGHALGGAEIAQWIATWGYLGLFVCVFVGNLGVPVPEELALLTAGVLAAHDLLALWAVYLVSIASAVAGDSSGYMIGRRGGKPLMEGLARRFQFIHRGYHRFRMFFSAHGPKTVFMARFITGLRFCAGPMAGASGMHFRTFLFWNVLGALIWCTLMVTVGYAVGDSLGQVLSAINRDRRWLALVGAMVLFIVWAWWSIHRSGKAPFED